MDVFYVYTYGNGLWLTLQAFPLVVSPAIMVTLLSPDVREPTPLEVYFSRSLGISLVTLGVLIIVLSGSVPLTSSFSYETAEREAPDPKAPYAVPTLTISMLYHSATAFYCYARYTSTGQLGFALGTLGSAGLGSVGLWCILFTSQDGRISRKTGADKRTSGFPFGNSQSARAKNKQLGKAI